MSDQHGRGGGGETSIFPWVIGGIIVVGCVVGFLSRDSEKQREERRELENDARIHRLAESLSKHR